MTLDLCLPLCRKYRSKGVLLDTNLFLLYLIGFLDPNLIGRFKPLANHQFDERDYRLVEEIVGQIGILITTPHILAEVSNHADKLKGDTRHERVFRALSQLVKKLKEQPVPAIQIVDTTEFARLGLTDAAICKTAKGEYLVLTTDFALYGTLKKNGADAINFTHLRGL